MSDSGNISEGNVVDKLHGQFPAVARAILKTDVHDAVLTVQRQLEYEQVGFGDLKLHLAEISKTARKLDALLFSNNKIADAARRSISRQLTDAEYDGFHEILVDLTNDRILDGTEFSSGTREDTLKELKVVNSAAYILSRSLEKYDVIRRVVRRGVSTRATYRFRTILTVLDRAGKTDLDTIDKEAPATSIVAEVARRHSNYSTGGRPFESAKSCAVWATHVLVNKHAISADKDSRQLLQDISEHIYELASGERDPDLSHAVNSYLANPLMTPP